MLVTAEELSQLQENVSNVRNICIMAHVDHGKTSLADCLLSSNDIVSENAIGERRYMDSRADEQKRGITMKSSSIMLKFTADDDCDYLINLIDTPGHLDFSSEVSCAVRLCDGVVVVVDAVEGVCPQTRAVMQQAYAERMEMILFVNKLDRLINDLGLSTQDAYNRIRGIVDQMNVLLSCFYQKEISESDSSQERMPLREFDPTSGNVLFGSAIDGWAFNLGQFSKMYTMKLGISATEIAKKLWGDFYFNPKSRQFHTGAISNNKKPCFVSMALDNIWKVYHCFRSENFEFANVQLWKGAILSNNDDSCKQLTKEFMRNWLPAHRTVLQAVVTHHPSPCALSNLRIRTLMSNDHCSFESLPDESRQLAQAFERCSSNEGTPFIAFVSKMILMTTGSGTSASQLMGNFPVPVLPSAKKSVVKSQNDPLTSDSQHLIAFVRVFSGRLIPGMSLYVLTPKFKPNASCRSLIVGEDVARLQHTISGGYALEAVVGQVYLLMGVNMQPVSSVPAGSIAGVAGLDNVILKSATLSSTLMCPSFSAMQFHSNPIVKVSVEPDSFRDMERVSTALQTLVLSDPNLEYSVEDYSGQSILYVTGEVHLQRCLTDLEKLFGLTSLKVSPPIVPFMESMGENSDVGKQADVQILPHAYYQQLPSFVKDEFEDCHIFENGCPVSNEKSVQAVSQEDQIVVRMKCVTIPPELRAYLTQLENDVKQEESCPSLETVKNTMRQIVSLRLTKKKQRRLWLSICDRVWCFGSKTAPCNLLVDCLAERCDESVYFHQVRRKNDDNESVQSSNAATSGVIGAVQSGYYLAINAGPLIEEPLTGVCFILEDIQAQTTTNTSIDLYTGGRLMSVVKKCCRCSYLASGSVRLSLPMYETTVYLSSVVMGKAYAVLGKREAKILSEDVLPGTNLFTIVAQMPVTESFGFAAEILNSCRGLAQPQMTFSHWQILDLDPFWTPGTSDEIELHGKNPTAERTHNTAMKYIREVRKRKGLTTDKQLVEFAEKQRTFKRNK